MITTKEIKTDNYWTDGLNISLSDPMTLDVTGGSFHHRNRQEEIVTEFEPFSFDIDSDPEFEVVYDVYLLQNGEPYVLRSVWAGDVIPAYTGEVPLVFTLATFVLPPATTSLDNINIQMNKAVKEDEEVTSSPEQTSQPEPSPTSTET